MECPSCGETMETGADPDIEYETCPACGGSYFERGELNALATGLAGDIEYCSVDTDPHPDEHPVRRCPECGSSMGKVNLLELSDLVFDHCTDCGSFFLDAGEVGAMNAELRGLADSPAESEIREERDGLVVRVEHASYVRAPGDFTPARSYTYLKTSVYFDPSLEIGLRISDEAWSTRLAALLGLADDLEVGDEAFDRRFRVEADDPAEARSVLDGEIRRALVAFDRESPHVVDGAGHGLEVYDDRVVYTEGPFDPEAEGRDPGFPDRVEAMADRLADVAARLRGAAS